MQVYNKTVTLSDGKPIHIETGRLARQADGSVVVRCGDTMLLATVVANKEIDKELDFLPLSVDYVEKYASSGKIPGGFFKREGRLGEHEILTSRLVDRALRPLFPDDYHGNVQVIIQLISADREVQSDSLACFAACCALRVSDIPFHVSVAEARVVRSAEGQFIVNPTIAEMEGVDLDLMVAATADSVVMVEGEMSEVSEEVMLEAIRFAHDEIKKLTAVIEELRSEVNPTMREYEVLAINEEIRAKVTELTTAKFEEIARGAFSKEVRSDMLHELKEEVKEKLTAEYGENEEIESLETQIKLLFKEVQKKIVRGVLLNEGKRLDGRSQTDIRDIWTAVSYLPRAHGSALFTRGETQSLTSVTLGTKLDEQTIDRATEEGSKRFMLHYNFPPFSVGEARFLRGPGRREIGHGNLAERALKMVMPEDFDYTTRIVCEILESNGSSSMASVCGGSMALMDAGAPIKGSVSGIAMGLITDESGRFAVLSDILGDEDFLGDMDFKVAGTRKGLTACQMDIKISGLSYEIMEKALAQSLDGRMHILEKMEETISEPAAEMSPYAPRLFKMEIPSDMIGSVIGPGGKIIQDIQKTSGTTIIIDEDGNKGIVTISSTDEAGKQKAEEMIKAIVVMPEVGAIYKAKVKSIKDFGAFVEFLPGKEGLLHISEIEHHRLRSMDGVMEIGDEFEIKIIGVDARTGKFRLSKKALTPVPEGMEEQQDGGRHGGGDRRGGGGRGDRGDRRGPRRDGRGGGGRHGGGGGRHGGGDRRENRGNYGGGGRENEGGGHENNGGGGHEQPQNDAHAGNESHNGNHDKGNENLD